MASVDEFLAEAQRFRGQPYDFGGEIPESWDASRRVGPVDCSELTSVAARRVGVSLPDGAYNQWSHCRSHGSLIPVEKARSTRGALLFYDDGSGSGRDRVVHVAISLGDGTTFEAWTEGKPVGSYDARRERFTIGGLIPGIDYETEEDDVSAYDVWQYGMTDWTGEDKTVTAIDTLAQARYDSWDAVRRLKALEERLASVEAALAESDG